MNQHDIKQIIIYMESHIAYLLDPDGYSDNESYKQAQKDVVNIKELIRKLKEENKDATVP